MAVITPSALISEIRGSVGMQTFSKNRYGPYVKAKLVQPPSNTLPQQDVRAAQAAAVAEWQGLTQAVMDKWMNYANDNVISGRISRKFVRAGYNEYISRCMNRFAVAGAGSGFEPLPKVRLFPIITSVTTAASNITINFDTMKPIGNCDLVVYATPPVSAGINEINPSLYRIIGIITPAAQISSANIYSAYNTYYGLTGADIGKKIGIAIKAINTDNFAAGQFFFVQTTISGGLVSGLPRILQFKNNRIQAAKTITLSFDSPINEGELIILTTAFVSSSNPTGLTGFTVFQATSLAGFRINIWYKFASAFESGSYTASMTDTASAVGIEGYVIKDANITTPLTSLNFEVATWAQDLIINPSFTSIDNSIFFAMIVVNARSTRIWFLDDFIDSVPYFPYSNIHSSYKYFTIGASGQQSSCVLPQNSSTQTFKILFRVNPV